MGRAATLLLLALAVAGCAAPPLAPMPPAGTSPEVPAGQPQWWRVQIRMEREPGDSVNWSLDALLADQVVAPLVSRFGPALRLWRVHRRAANDDYGHQLSFIFYADRGIAERVFTALRASAVLDAMMQAGLVRELVIPGPAESMGAGIGATSDASWPPPIQRTWPHYIQGVSAHWLALIADLRARHPLPEPPSLDAMVEAYEDINDEVDALWQAEGQHAYLHHLNALFGYQPLLIQERRLSRF